MKRGVSINPADFSSDSDPAESKGLKGEPMPKQDTRTGKSSTAKPPKVRDHFIVLSPSSPLDSASRFISEHCTQGGVRTLHYHRGDFTPTPELITGRLKTRRLEPSSMTFSNGRSG